jgi:cytochrome c556
MRLLHRLGPLGRATAAAALAATALGFGSHLYAQAKGDFMADIPIVDLMDSIVMPSAQIVWDAVAFESTTEGDIVTGPKTDEDWQKLRWAAVALAESANNLAVPGRKVSHPGAKAAEGELAPEKIQALIDANRPAWVAHAHVLYAAAMEAVKAIDAKNADGVSDAGGTIDSACEGCHLEFWYPDQATPQ